MLQAWTTIVITFIQLLSYGNAFLKGHLQPLGFQRHPSMCTQQLNEVPQPKQFFDDYVIGRRPVIFKGAAQHSSASQRWSVEQLIERYGDLVVRVEARYEGSEKIPATESGYGRDTIRHFASHYQSTNSYIISQVPSPMEGDVSIPPCLGCGRFVSSIQEVHMFIVGKGGKTLLHRDPYSNIHCVFNGTKEWILIPDNQNVYESLESSSEFGGFSLIDVERVDLSKHPDVAKLKYSKVDLRKGDCLFIPGGLWHQVNVVGEYNTAVSIWFSRNFKNSPQDWSNCDKDGHGFVPMSNVDIIWRFSGGNTSLTQGHMDVHILRSILLMLADSYNRTSIKQFCHDLTDTEIEQDELLAEFRLVLNLTSDLVTTDQINTWPIETLKKLLLVIDPSDPFNHVELEYYVIDADDVRFFLHEVRRKFSSISCKEFVKRYSKLGGTREVGGQIFQMLDRNRDHVITGDEITRGYDKVVDKYTSTANHSPGTERKWYNFFKANGLL